VIEILNVTENGKAQVFVHTDNLKCSNPEINPDLLGFGTNWKMGRDVPCFLKLGMSFLSDKERTKDKSPEAKAKAKESAAEKELRETKARLAKLEAALAKVS